MRDVIPEKLLVQWKLNDQYRDGPKRAHNWHSGWLAEAVDMPIRAAK